jgi:acyl-CoA thioester hydrolase
MTDPSSRPHRIAVRVYWEDTDAGGIVYHSNYLNFMERGRTEFLRDLGVNQSELMAEHALAFTVRRMVVAFDRPAVLDDLLTVETLVADVGGASLRLGQRVLRGDAVLVTGDVTIACVGGGRPKRLPADIRALFLSVQ